MDVLRASGTFDVNGWFGLAGWPSINLNTNGEKRFEAKLVNATLEPVIEIDIDGGCDDEGNAIITEMSSPLVYDDITFDTGDVNYFVNDAFVAALTFFFETNNLATTASAKTIIQTAINNLFCASVINH